MKKNLTHFGKYNFVDKSNGRKKMCMVLAGYKQPIWDDVFSRLKAYIPENIDAYWWKEVEVYFKTENQVY